MYEGLSRAIARTFAYAEKISGLMALTALTMFALHIGDFSVAPKAPPISFHFFSDRLFDKPAASEPSMFEQETAMTSSELLNRWNPFIAEAAKKFGLPESWIRAVIARESGGRTMMAENTPIASSVGAVGIMQLMPDTYNDMRAAYKLGDNPADPHDSVIAGAAYLSWLHRKYGFPNMFAAYNDGPTNFDRYLAGARELPAETVAYLSSLSDKLGGGDVNRTRRKRRERFTREARVSQRFAVSG